MQKIAYGAGKMQSFSKLSYIIGSSDCTIEVVVAGEHVHKVAETVHSLQGKVITLHGVIWDNKYMILKHAPAFFVQLAEQWTELFAGVSFQLSQIHSIGAVKCWSRLSVKGCIHSIDMPQVSERKAGQSFCDCFLQNQTGQAVKLRICTCNTAMPLLHERQEIVVQNCKVNSSSETLYADLDDLCSQLLDIAGTQYPTQLSGMIVWHAQ